MTALDPRIDLDGGGDLVSTTHDLATFFQALVFGGVFDDPATFELMISDDGTPGVGRGVFVATLYGERCAEQSTWWGVTVLACRSTPVVAAGTWLSVLESEKWDGDPGLRQLYEAGGVQFWAGG